MIYFILLNIKKHINLILEIMNKYIKIGNLVFKKELIKKAVIHNENLTITYLRPKYHMDEFKYCLTTFNLKNKKYNKDELYSCPNILIETII